MSSYQRVSLFFLVVSYQTKYLQSSLSAINLVPPSMEIYHRYRKEGKEKKPYHHFRAFRAATSHPAAVAAAHPLPYPTLPKQN